MKNLFNKIGLVASHILLMWVLWQLDGLAGGFGTLAPHWNELYGFWLYPTFDLFTMTKGLAFDSLYMLIAVALIFLDVSFWTWSEE